MSFQPELTPDLGYFIACDGPACRAYLGHDADPELAHHLQEMQLPARWAGPGRAPGNWLLTPIRHLCPPCADAESRALLAGLAGAPTSEEPTL